MEKAKWIWINGENNQDEYGEFISTFTVLNDEKVIVNLSSDSVYNLFVNGDLVAFSNCSDFPWFKYYDEIDITKYCKEQNELKVVVWYSGLDTQTYITDKAGVIFEVEQNGKVLAYSSKETKCRKMIEYKNGYKKLLTLQLGYSFLYDGRDFVKEYTKSVEVEKQSKLHKRPIKLLRLEDKSACKIIKQDKSVLVDIGKETAGFLEFDIESETEQKLTITYGEHIVDGGVRRNIGIRDFSLEYIAKKGKNVYTNTIRRIAGRYIEIFSESPIKVNYLGIRAVNYPLTVNGKKFNDELTQKIYDTCIDTLRLCIHEHYEDCPWREQALYTMDSRNQMLCGYYVFEGTEYQRYNLGLIAKSIRDDGLLAICAPSGLDVPIPFFSLCYILEVYEYVKYTKDTDFIEEIKDVLTKIIKTFEGKLDENNLITSFPYPYWNFYEWADESNNEWQITRTATDKNVVSYDLILNCMYVYVGQMYNELLNENIEVEKVKKSIEKVFKNGEVYRLSNLTEKSSQLGNSLAILIGLGGKKLAEKIVKGDGMISATLSMRAFVYDALLKTDKEYKKYILNDIKERYGKMLNSGATSFWETEKGEADFDGAGSMCHGWSAIPIYYFNILK